MRQAEARARGASRRRGKALAAWLALGLVSALPQIASAEPPRLRVDIESWMERQDLRAQGLLLEFGISLRVPIDPTQSPALRRETHYSPALRLVFDVRSPGYLPAPPEYYLYDGAYYVYTPRDFSAPALSITAAPRTWHQDLLVASTDRKLREGTRGPRLGPGTERGAGQGFEVTVVSALPGPLSTMFGRDATTIRVTGRESISFAGEARRVSPYIANEQGRGQSLFPRLDMDQDLQVKLEGNIGGKVHVAVDHNSSVFGADANRVNVWYEGYEDDIVRRIDLGGTNLTLPGSRLVAPAGLSQGVFGVKADMRLAGLDLTVLAAKEETEAETRTLTPSGGSATTFPIEENRYVRDRFFFYDLPDTSSIQWYFSYGLDPGFVDDQNEFSPGQLIEESFIPNFRVFIDDRNPNTEEKRPFYGYGVASLAQGLTTAEMDAAYNATSNAARWPIQEAGVNFGDENFRIAKWRQLREEEIGFVLFDANGKKLVLGFYLRYGQVGDSHALGVSYQDPRRRVVGNVDEGSPPIARLRLVRHPEQDSEYTLHPTAPLMMRHVYLLSATNIQDLELSIESRSAGNQAPNVPQRLPQSTYLHMFGLDEYDQANRRFPDGGPDGLFDSRRANLLDRENGFLFMPGLRPFSPPAEIITQRLITAGVPQDSAVTYREDLFGASETVSPTMYTLPRNDQTIPQNQYQLLVRTSGTETEITLPQDILEGSDVVRLDGRTLTRGVDYDIEPVAGGKISFKGPVLNEITPSSRIEVSYAFRPLLGSGQATLFGASGKYSFGNRGYLASVWLWESRRSFARQPQIGDEPSRNLVGDVNLSLRFLPGWMTRVADLLPFTRTKTGSSLTMTAEAAISMPNPNTKNTAFVEDMESADTSDRVSSGREAWHWASLPDPAAILADSVNRIPTAFYNPSGRVKRGHLNPTLPETEANDGITVLELGFDRQSVRNLLSSEPFRAPQLWSGVMSAFAANGFDLTQTRTVEFWVNDGIGDPAARRGRMHIDFGDISEDFVFFKNNPDRPLDNNTSFNREAVSEFQFIPTTDDLGWNGRKDNCPGEDTPWPLGVDCHLPSRINSDGQHTWANGTEGDNRFDTEDINGDGEWDTKNSFFRYTLDLADVSLVDPGTDITPTYGNDPSVDPELRPGFQGWRHYRLDLQKILLDSIMAPGQTPPSLRQIRYLRLWFEDPAAPPEPDAQLWTQNNFQIHDFKFTGSQWLQLGVFGVDSTQVVPEVDESYSVSVINNKESPEYTIPPDADLIDTAGVQAREQALRLTFSQLRPGHEMVTQKTNPQGRPTDYTLYQRMDFFTNYRAGPLDSVEVFFRMGTDSLNFYEVARAVQGGSDWQETAFDLRSLTDLKFPEDLGAPVDTLFLGGREVVQVTRTMPDALNPAFVLRLTRRGNPSLKQVGRLFVGVRHLRPAMDTTALPVSGELWFNNVRVEDVKREAGTAQLYALQGNFADVFDFTTSLSLRDAEFLGLRQRTGSGSETVSFNTSLKIPDAARLVPTLGFTIPLSYNLARDINRPKFSTASDTENDAARAEEQRNESVRRGYALSVSKKPSRFFLFKPTLDRTVFSYNESRTQNRSFTTRDTSVSWSQSLNYDLSPKARPLPLFSKQQLNLLPTNIKFGLRHQNGRNIGYTVTNPATGLLVPKPPSGVRTLDLNASAAVRPMTILNAHYNFSESRDYRDAAAENEAERFSLAGFDFGIPTGRSEALSVDLNPRFFQYSYSSSYGDRRTLQIDATTGLPRPDLHQVSNGRTHRFSFDFKLHRRLAALAGAPPRAGQRPPQAVPLGNEPPPGGDEDNPGGEPGAGEGSLPGSEKAPVPGREEPPAPGSSTPPDGTTPAPADSSRGGGQKRFPNPVKALVRFVGSVEPVKVEWNDTRTASHVSVPYGAMSPFRYGLSTDSGVIGFSDPSPLNNTMGLNLSSAIPLRGALRVTVRYGLRDTDIETRSGRDSLLRVNINSSRETTFPGLEFSVNDLQKLRIFSSRLQRSTLTLGFVRTASERVNRDYDQSGNLPKETNKRQAENLTLTANWTGAWKGTTTTTLGFNQTSGEESETGQRTTNKRRSMTGTLRFKLSPKGGFKLPWIGALKTGVDVLLNGSYNTDEGFLFNNNPNDPSRSIPQRQTSAITGGVRGDYTLARNMTGGVELGYTRNRDDKNNQTVSTVRLGFNLTFLF